MKSLNLIASYLTSKYEQVVVGTKSSTFGLIEWGVPEKDVFFPLLYLVCTTDIVYCTAYADDTQLPFPHKISETDHYNNKVNLYLEDICDHITQFIY